MATKKTGNVLIATVVTVILGIFVSCASAPKNEPSVEKKQEKKRLVVTDHPTTPEDWAKFYTQKGIDALEVKKGGKANFSAAVQFFTKATEAYPKSPTVWFNLGLVYQQMGDDENAVKNYNLALQLEPTYARPVINKAAIYANKLEYNRAIDVCEKFLEENPKDKAVLSAVAGFYLKKRDFLKAIESVRKILIQEPANMDALKNLGMIYLLKKDMGLANMVTTNSYNLNPNDAGIANNRGVIFHEQGDDSLAMFYYTQALNLDAQNKAANFNVGTIAMSYGDAERAFHHFSVVLAQDPDNLDARVGLALAYRGLGNFAEAEAEYKKVLDKDPNNPLAVFNLGVLYHDHMNKKVEAQSLFRKYLSIGGEIGQDHIVHKYIADKVRIRPTEEEQTPQNQ